MTSFDSSAPRGPRGPWRGRRAFVLGGAGLVLGVVAALGWQLARPDAVGPTTQPVG